MCIRQVAIAKAEMSLLWPEGVFSWVSVGLWRPVWVQAMHNQRLSADYHVRHCAEGRYGMTARILRFRLRAVAIVTKIPKVVVTRAAVQEQQDFKRYEDAELVTL